MANGIDAAITRREPILKKSESSSPRKPRLRPETKAVNCRARHQEDDGQRHRTKLGAVNILEEKGSSATLLEFGSVRGTMSFSAD